MAGQPERQEKCVSMTFSAAVVYIINYNLISLYVQTVIIIYERDVSDKNPMYNNIILYMLSLTMSIKRKCGVIQSDGGDGHLNYLHSVNSTYLLKTSPAAAAHHSIIYYINISARARILYTQSYPPSSPVHRFRCLSVPPHPKVNTFCTYSMLLKYYYMLYQ